MPNPLPKPDLDAFPPSAVLVPGDPLFRALARCHVIISQLLKCRWGWGLQRSLSEWGQKPPGSGPPGERNRNADTWALGPHLLNLHFNKPHSQVIFMHFENYCIRV